MKKVYAQGYTHLSHLDHICKNKEKFFKDIEKLSRIVGGDHFSIFYDVLKPIDDNLEETIKLYRGIKLGSDGKFDGDRRGIQKIIDTYERRANNYIFNCSK